MNILIETSGKIPSMREAAEADLVILLKENQEPLVWKYRYGLLSDVSVTVAGEKAPSFAWGR